MNDSNRDCERFREDLTAWLDGPLPRDVAEHLAVCDACRDLRHEVRRAAQSLSLAGSDHKAPNLDALTANVMALIEDLPTESAAGVSATVELPAVNERAVSATVEVPVVRALDKHENQIAKNKSRKQLHISKRKALSAVLAAVVAAASVGLVALKLRPSGDAGDVGARVSAGVWSGRVTTVLRASRDGAGGLSVRRPGRSEWESLSQGALVTAGARLRTDPRTRVRVQLGDGSVIVLDRATEVLFDPSQSRSARLVSGVVALDVTHLENAPNARIATPVAAVEVVGTRFTLTASDEHTTLAVTRGAVRFTDGVRTAEVHAGEEAVMARGELTVAPAADLAGSGLWSELSASPSREVHRVGLGELVARRPGSSTEREHAVKLTRHSVKVRVSGIVARTEIEEVFRNDTGSELEGIYRFPLPPEAQIESLALDVNGTMEPGAFVDRERGAAIWRGVLRHATPRPRPTTEEWVWVPGPWRDPALLEWQRGGRFELRVFPIPARGERKIKITYTQTVASTAGQRRYVYPLPYDPGGSTTVDHFEVDLQVRGNDSGEGVRTSGYSLSRVGDTEPGVSRFHFAQDGFVPSGDLTVEYSLPNRDDTVTAWAWAPAVTTTTAQTSQTSQTSQTVNDGGTAGDTVDPYVAFALRPTLPRWNVSRPRDYVFVVDTSRSMVGERLTRAARITEAIIAGIDRRDRAIVLACDLRCEALHGDSRVASAELAREASRFVSSREAAGASDLGGQVHEAVRAAGEREPERELKIVYIGDGVATAGHRRPEALAEVVRAELPARDAGFIGVAIGADADTATLDAMARAGGGTVVTWAPGQSVSSAAMAVLEATWGVMLRDPVVELPDGLDAVAPRRLSNLRAGSEVIVSARMRSGRRTVNGDVVLRGTVNSEPFELRRRVEVTAAEANGFVPRLWGAARIADLEAAGDVTAREEAVRLSQRLNLASRYTSLLVLESPAMFRAFGVDRTHQETTWTGEQDTVAARGEGDAPGEMAAVDEARGSEDNEDDDGLSGMVSSRGDAPVTSALGGVGQGYGHASPVAARPRRENADAPALPMGSVAQATPIDMANTRGAAAVTTPSSEAVSDLRRRQIIGRPQGQWMRRVWVRTAAIEGERSAEAYAARVRAARERVAQNPDSRERYRELYRWLSLAGELNEAESVARRWSERDPLDVDALTRLADIALRKGDRAKALRYLASTVDARPQDAARVERLAIAYARLGDEDGACAWRASLAELRRGDANAQAAALRCERARGHSALAALVLEGSEPAVRARADALAAEPTVVAQSNGELAVEGRWSGGGDADIVLVAPDGLAVSWMGGRTRLLSQGVTSETSERLGVSWASQGEWRVEVVRGAGESALRGTVTVSVLGRRRVFDVSTEGDRDTVGRVVMTRRSELVPVGGQGWR